MKKIETFNKLPKIATTNSKILLLTHTDMDGSGPVVILNSIFDNVYVKHLTNALMSESIKNIVLGQDDKIDTDYYDYIIVCDISCNADDAALINNSPNKKKLIILDHHVTAEHLNQYDWACIIPDNIDDSFRLSRYPKKIFEKLNESGTSLLYDYLIYCGFVTINRSEFKLLNDFVDYVALYDTWNWNDLADDFKNTILAHNNTNPYKLNKLFEIYGFKRFEKNFVDKIKKHETKLFNNLDTTLLDIDDSKCKHYVNRKSKSMRIGEMSFNGTSYSIAYVYADQYLAEVFEMMDEENPSVDILAINTGSGVSLRSRNDADVSLIAIALGGGGHKNAAGFPISDSNRLQFMETLFNTSIS